MMIKEPQVNERPVMGFWPHNAEPKVREVFASRTSRMLWLGIKNQHIVNQHFNDHCIKLGESLDHEIAKGTEINGHKLNIWLQNLGRLITLPNPIPEIAVLFSINNLILDAVLANMS